MLVTEDGTEITLAQDAFTDNQIVLEVTQNIKNEYLYSDEEMDEEQSISAFKILKQ